MAKIKRDYSIMIHYHGYSVPFIKSLLNEHFDKISINTDKLSKGHLVYTGDLRSCLLFQKTLHSRLTGEQIDKSNLNKFFNKFVIATATHKMQLQGMVNINYLALVMLGYDYIHKDLVKELYEKFSSDINTYFALANGETKISYRNVSIICNHLLEIIESYIEKYGTILYLPNFLDFILLDDLDEDCELKYMWLRLLCAENVGIHSGRKPNHVTRIKERYTGVIFGRLDDEYRDVTMALIRGSIVSDMKDNLNQVHKSSLYRAITKLVNSPNIKDDYYIPMVFSFIELITDILQLKDIPKQANDGVNTDRLDFIHRVLSLRSDINSINYSSEFNTDNKVVVESEHIANTLRHNMILHGWTKEPKQSQ